MKKRVSLLILLAFFILSCSPKGVSVEKPAAPESPVQQSQIAGKETWQAEWEKVLEAGRKEKKVVIYGGEVTGEMRYQLSSAFSNKYGIVAEIETGRSTGLTERVVAERKAGLYLPDLVTGGLGSSLHFTYKPGGMVEPVEQFLILPEVKDLKYWWSGFRFNDKERTALAFGAYVTHGVAVNTELVKEGELKSYFDLLAPKWKGKILLSDPTLPGIANRWIGFAIKILGTDYLKELVRQEPTILRDQRLHVDWLARGKFPIAITPQPAAFAEFQKAGAPVKTIVMAEGAQLTAGAGCIVYMNRAPHPNAAKIFLNWFLTKEAQTIWSQLSGIQSGRLDAPTDFLPPASIRKEGVKYLDQNTEEYILQEPEFTRIAKEIFGPLMK